MEKQSINMADFGANFGGYYESHKIIEGAKGKREECRKFLEPIIKAHKIPVGDNKAWKALQPMFSQEFLWLEGPRDDDGLAIPHEDLTDTEMRQIKARVAAWLGVLRTCLEYQILPTDKNADRLRKTKVWTGLNGNGKVNPNWVDPKAKKPEPEASKPEPDAASEEEAEKQTDALMAKIEAQVKKEGSKKLNAIGNALALATMEPGAGTKTDSKASNKATTGQKTETAIHPLTSNVSSSEAPISAREHFGILFAQMLKNETFRTEYTEILAMMLDVDKATLTRCMVQARDEIK